jgi:membrane protein DedA with SNARE-associated domain
MVFSESASRSDGVVSAGEVWVYSVFFVTLVAAGLGLPAPEELVISGAGVLAGQLPPPPYELEPKDVAALLAVDPNAGSVGGLPWAALDRVAPAFEASPPSKIHVRWWILLPVCILGVVCSDVLLYVSGRFLGDRLLRHRWLAHLMPPQRRQRTEENFHRYGVSLLVFGRLVPGIRAPLFLTAGSMRLPLPRFLLADGLGAVVGNSLFFFLGFWLGGSVNDLIKGVEEKLKPILIIVAVGLVVAYLLWLFLRHPVSTGDPSEVPLIGPQVASHIEQTESAEEHPYSNGEPAEKDSPPTKHPPPQHRRTRRFRLLLIVLSASALATWLVRLFRRKNTVSDASQKRLGDDASAKRR